MGDFLTFLARSVSTKPRKEYDMHDIGMVKQDKWRMTEPDVKVSHQIFSLSEDTSAMVTLYGLSLYAYFAIPVSLAILGFVLCAFGGPASLTGSVLHLIVSIWVFSTYLAWVYGVLGFELQPESPHSPRTQHKYSSKHSCCGFRVRILRYRPRFHDENRRSASIYPAAQTAGGIPSAPSTQQPPENGPGPSSIPCPRNNFITKAWT